MQTPFANPHAQAVAAMLRHTVYNPAAPTMPIAYHCWHRINSILWSKPIVIHESEIDQLTQDFCELIASITEATGMQITQDDLSWLLGLIFDRDATTLSLLMAMATMQPSGDTISTGEAAEMLGHADNTVIRKWCADGRFLSARKLDGRTWTVARSEIMLHHQHSSERIQDKITVCQMGSGGFLVWIGDTSSMDDGAGVDEWHVVHINEFAAWGTEQGYSDDTLAEIANEIPDPRLRSKALSQID